MSMLLLQTFLLMLTAFFLGALVACLVKSTFFDVAADRPVEVIPVPAPMAQPRPAAVMPQPPPRPAPEAVRPKIETVARPASAPSMPLPDAQRFERALKEQTAASVTAATPQATTAATPPAAIPAAAPKPPVTVTTAPIAPAAPAAPVVVPPAADATRPGTAVPAVPRVEIKPAEPVKPAAPAAIPAAPAATVSAPQPAPVPAPVPAPSPAPTSAPAPAPAAAVKLDLGSAAAVAAAAAIAAARTRPAEAAPKVEAAPARPAPVSVTPPPAVAPASAPQPVMPAAAGSSGPASVSAQVSMPTPADDLTHIRAIDTALQSRLNALGVRRYEDIARWSSADVKRLRADAGVGTRITTENWIEQAQILAKGGTTDYARRRAAAGKGVAMAAPLPNAGVAAPLSTPVAAPVTAPVAAPSSAPASAPAPGKAVEAAPKPVAAAPASSAPSSSGPASSGPATPVFELPRSGAQAAAAAAAAIAAAAAASARRSEAASTPAAPSPVPTAAVPGAVAARDDLQRIHGISAEVEKLLHVQGVTRFTQIAGWTARDTDRFNGLLGTPGRIARENWIEQAAVLASGTAGAYARRADLASRPVEADASRPARLADALRERESANKATEPERAAAVARPDLSNLRSVRSEALRGDVAGSGAAADDLKRIRGIGVLIEKKLNSLGVSSYEQVANWTGADIDRISQILDFKGRIERENWVEQSRILASGGQTEFSRRVDKGDA